jgi:hypothetical protein
MEATSEEAPAEEAAAEEEPEPDFVHVGCTFVCRADVADEVAKALRVAVEAFLEDCDFSDDEIVDYGVD